MGDGVLVDVFVSEIVWLFDDVYGFVCVFGGFGDGGFVGGDVEDAFVVGDDVVVGVGSGVGVKDFYFVDCVCGVEVGDFFVFGV